MALFKALRNTVNSMVHSLEWFELPLNKAPALWVLMLSFRVTVLLFSVGVRTVLVSHSLEGERGLRLAVNRASWETSSDGLNSRLEREASEGMDPREQVC